MGCYLCKQALWVCKYYIFIHILKSVVIMFYQDLSQINCIINSSVVIKNVCNICNVLTDSVGCYTEVINTLFKNISTFINTKV